MLGQLVATLDARRVMNFGLTCHNCLEVGSNSRRVLGVIFVPWRGRLIGGTNYLFGFSGCDWNMLLV